MEEVISFIEKDSEKLWTASLITNLKLTPEMRIEAHENALKLLVDLSKAGKDLRARSKKTA